MKEFIEEYGGVVTAAMTGLGLLALMAVLINDSGAVYELVHTFFAGLGASGV